MNLAQWLPRGGLIEVSGAAGGGRIEAVLGILAENPDRQAAWIEEGGTLYPCAFPQHGVSLERVLFVNAQPEPQLPSQMMDCAHQILKSGIFGAVILLPRDPAHFDQHFTMTPTTSTRAGCSGVAQGAPREIELRRLQIMAEKAGAAVFILSEKPTVECTWPLAVQLQISRDSTGKVQTDVLKRRHFSQEVFHADCLSLLGKSSSSA